MRILGHHQTTACSLLLASASAVCAQERPTPLYAITTPLTANQPFAITTTVPGSNPRAQYVAVAKAAEGVRCVIICTPAPLVEVVAWQDTTTSLVQTTTSGSARVSGGLAAVGITGLDSGRVVTADVDTTGVLSIRTWSVQASGVSLQNGYSSASGTASSAVAIAALSSTEVVTAYALPNGTLAVEAWTIAADGLPAPVSTVGYQSDDMTGNEVLPAGRGVFASQVSIAAVNPNEVVTAIGDSSKSMWVTTWAINNGVEAQQLQQIPNTVDTSLPGNIAVGAGQISKLVPGPGPFELQYETTRSAFTPFANSSFEVNVLYWTISASGQLTQQPALKGTCSYCSGVAATMLPTNVPMTSYDSGPAECQIEDVYHGYPYETDSYETSLCPGLYDPPAVYNIEYTLSGPVASTSEGTDQSWKSTFEPYNAYFVTASGDQILNLLYIQVFSYPLPPLSLVL